MNNCLNALRDLHCEVETIKTNDICAGRLKAILTLFFSLSQYKQATLSSQKQKLGGSSAIKFQQPMPLQPQQMSHTIERWVRAVVSKALPKRYADAPDVSFFFLFLFRTFHPVDVRIKRFHLIESPLCYDFYSACCNQNDWPNGQ